MSFKFNQFHHSILLDIHFFEKWNIDPLTIIFDENNYKCILSKRKRINPRRHAWHIIFIYHCSRMGREEEGTSRREGALPSNPGPPVGSGSSGIGGNQPERVRGSIVIQGHPTRSMSNPAIVVNDMLCNTAVIILWCRFSAPPLPFSSIQTASTRYMIVGTKLGSSWMRDGWKWRIYARPYCSLKTRMIFLLRSRGILIRSGEIFLNSSWKGKEMLNLYRNEAKILRLPSTSFRFLK